MTFQIVDMIASMQFLLKTTAVEFSETQELGKTLEIPPALFYRSEEGGLQR